MFDINDQKSALRLARTIASDLKLYNQKKVEEGLRKDALFEILAKEIQEGREHYESRVNPQILNQTHFLDRALVDVLIYSHSYLECPLW
jgi:hypothetical protein